MSWYVYLLSCGDGTLYTGITRDPHERVAAHNRGTGAAYTRTRRPVRLAYLEPAADRAAALRRELQIKSWPRRRKLELVQGATAGSPLLRVAGFGAPHGFATRHGGVSSGRYGTLNLGASTGDDPELVQRNREIFSSWFGVGPAGLRVLDQVHGDEVVVAEAGAACAREADAHVSDDPDLLLVVATADCVPILFFDPPSGAVGAAHCGWRGTAARLAGKVVRAMGEKYGSRPGELQVAIGPGICRSCYQVGSEVVEEFSAAGFPADIAVPDEEGRHRLDLVAANRHVLHGEGVSDERIATHGACTMCDPERFFSYRRDGGRRGLHWSAVRSPAAPRR